MMRAQVNSTGNRITLTVSGRLAEGWVPELRRYLETMHRDIKKDVDIVEWWQVSAHFQKSYFTNIKS